MPAYTLILSFTNTDLDTISAAGEKVVIARALSDSDSNIAWVSFKPFNTNYVSWDDSYGLYVSEAQPSASTIPRSTLPPGSALSGAYYKYKPAGNEFTTLPQDPPAAGSYRILNGMPSTEYPFLFFGLTQGANVNQVDTPPSPANTALVPANQLVTFTPLHAVYVWLQSNVAAGDSVQLPSPAVRVAYVVNSRSTMITFETPSTVTYSYNAEIGAFEPSGG